MKFVACSPAPSAKLQPSFHKGKSFLSGTFVLLVICDYLFQVLDEQRAQRSSPLDRNMFHLPEQFFVDAERYVLLHRFLVST
jgi:hypothetical protein